MNHVGIVVTNGTDRTAKIVEALSTVKRHRIADQYLGAKDEIAIYRPINLTGQERKLIVGKAESYVGKRYGWGKILAHGIDTLLLGAHFARRLARMDDRPICSWLVAYAYQTAGKDFGVKPYTAQPDDIWDFVTKHGDKYQCVRPLSRL